MSTRKSGPKCRKTSNDVSEDDLRSELSMRSDDVINNDFELVPVECPPLREPRLVTSPLRATREESASQLKRHQKQGRYALKLSFGGKSARSSR